jgi:hypothetical protein
LEKEAPSMDALKAMFPTGKVEGKMS